MTSMEFINTCSIMRSEGKTEQDIADHFSLTISELRDKYVKEKDIARKEKYELIESYYSQGKTYQEIAQMMGMDGETTSSIRSLLITGRLKKWGERSNENA